MDDEQTITTPESEPIEPEPEAAEAVEVVEPDPAAEQLSLDEMVDSLKDADPVAEAEAGETEVVDAPAEPEAPAAAVDEPIAPPDAPEAPEGTLLTRSRLAARLPFWILSGVWVVFAGVMTYVLWADATKPFADLPLYAGFIYGGVALTVAGLLVGVVVWLLLRRAAPELRAGLVRAVLLRAAAATLAGNLVWWAGLVVLDLHRSGVL
jgi:hypothetical protein